MIKALTLTQPWAALVATGAKRIETRSWSTSYRGALAIHAGKGLGPVGGRAGFVEFCTENERVYAALEDAGLVPFTWDQDALMALPRGAIVAVCTLVDCVPSEKIMQAFGAHGPMDSHGGHELWPLTDQELAFGNYAPGRFAWLLGDIRMLVEPIPATGKLGLWNWEAPAVMTVRE